MHHIDQDEDVTLARFLVRALEVGGNVETI